jgi:Putative prokaryotic signal transducing protein
VEDEPVRVAKVPGEPEAEALCGLLRSDGIECGFRPTNEADSAFEGFGGDGGAQEILVHPKDAERAREILADVEPA